MSCSFLSSYTAIGNSCKSYFHLECLGQYCVEGVAVKQKKIAFEVRTWPHWEHVHGKLDDGDKVPLRDGLQWQCNSPKPGSKKDWAERGGYCCSSSKQRPHHTCCPAPTATCLIPSLLPILRVLQSPIPPCLETISGIDLQHPGQARGCLNPANIWIHLTPLSSYIKLGKLEPARSLTWDH